MDPEARFLWEHQKADHIVYDAETGQVFAAEYTTARGVPRTFPVRFLFGGGAEYI